MDNCYGKKRTAKIKTGILDKKVVINRCDTYPSSIIISTFALFLQPVEICLRFFQGRLGLLLLQLEFAGSGLIYAAHSHTTIRRRSSGWFVGCRSISCSSSILMVEKKEKKRRTNRYSCCTNHLYQKYFSVTKLVISESIG